ncbi:MAG: Undecaprenyl-diphosphatase [Candidatus Moranbacteria bacterium GW2011_GWF2_36_839]|nr:MAG: Undecaprenyl-diphosphatase [Candidatus Moranbacteria bacterium GW2011_GWF1_36_78]KKQ17465.1 MAG: Undecaprenyl-diphosphatase [Candidatus Moranbacteria bacterium GW2011_GWF2_36_839]HAT73932.1 undecaprenyl-diphosphatase [Candidatus Moranbacteria bacterium]HBY10542.1 undecaprenyl-diphosphatase [Candidatus Moranbacteria bacterium]
MPNFFQVIILGIVEGITEFLPISSTAHLILTADILKLTQTEFLKSFEIIIQFGAILAVVVLYWKTLWKMEVIKKLVVAFIPTGILGLVFYKIIKTYLLGSVSVVLWTMFLGGIFLIIFEKWHTEKESALEDISNISYKQCLYIGLFQSIAMIPGVSRSAATILGGLALGLKRKIIVEFSFLLAVPTMLAATGLDLMKNYKSFSLSESHLLAVGFLVSFVMAILGIKFLLSYIQKRTFTAFGFYRILVSILFWLK